MVWVWVWMIVACGGAPEPAPVPHAVGFPSLVKAVLRDDPAAVAQWSAGVVAPEHADSDAAATLGAAQGFFRFASDAGERRQALVAMARGCAECHVSQEVSEPQPYVPTGQPAVDAALAEAVFGASTNDALLRALAEGASSDSVVAPD